MVQSKYNTTYEYINSYCSSNKKLFYQGFQEIADVCLSNFIFKNLESFLRIKNFIGRGAQRFNKRVLVLAVRSTPGRLVSP
jgi:hypothetical protein